MFLQSDQVCLSEFYIKSSYSRFFCCRLFKQSINSFLCLEWVLISCLKVWEKILKNAKWSQRNIKILRNDSNQTQTTTKTIKMATNRLKMQNDPEHLNRLQRDTKPFCVSFSQEVVVSRSGARSLTLQVLVDWNVSYYHQQVQFSADPLSSFCGTVLRSGSGPVCTCQIVFRPWRSVRILVILVRVLPKLLLNDYWTCLK